AGDHSGQTIPAAARDLDGHARGPGKARRVEALIVYREPPVCVLDHRVPGVYPELPGPVARIVRADHNPAVLLGRLPETLDRHTAPRGRVEGVEHRPLSLRRVV